MLKRFLLAMAVVAASIWVPMWAWSTFDLEGTAWGPLMRLPIFIGIGVGGFLMWGILMKGFFGDD
jgi:hypothetical protein